MTEARQDPTDGPPCQVCGNSRGNRSFKAREMMFGSREEFLYYECARCGCLWIARVPDDLAKHYGAGYYSLQESALRVFVRRRPALYRVAHYARYHHAPRLPEWWPPGQTSPDAAVLDIGCGMGILLLHLKALGYKKLSGIDPFIEEDIRVPKGPTILKRSIGEIDGQFDLIVMNHSLEHIANPGFVFGELKRLLAPSGLAVIRTPVASGLAWREYRSDWVQLDAPRHLVVHTSKSIDTLSNASGLSVDRVAYDSSAIQFWGSEQYQRDIPLTDKRSYLRDPRKSIFTPQQIAEFERRATDLNAGGDGDQACFYLRHQNPRSL